MKNTHKYSNNQTFIKLEDAQGSTKSELYIHYSSQGLNPRYSGKLKGFYIDVK